MTENLNPKRKVYSLRLIAAIALLVVSNFAIAGSSNALNSVNPKSFSVKFSDTPLEQAFGMLSKLGHVNILLSKDVSGNISANLQKTNIDRAIRAVASISGYTAQRRGDTYSILPHDDFGKDTIVDGKQVKTFRVQYIDPGIAETLISKYLSRHGSVTLIPDRGILVIQDDPEFIKKAGMILAQVDVKPRQILIEAQILEITLQDDETLGVDWSSTSSNGSFGTSGLSTIGSTGFFLNYLDDNLEATIKALSEEGRVRTLSTPKLMVLEDEEAEVIIGDRIGFKVTTTINAVTSESVEFIESGVILKVKAAVDNDEKIMLDIHPEVSSGSITEGIPSISTTEVSTQMIAGSGESIFIGGLMKSTTTDKTTGVPVLSKIPILGRLFSKTEETSINTETIVIIRPHLIEDYQKGMHAVSVQRFEALTNETKTIETNATSLTTPIAMQNKLPIVEEATHIRWDPSYIKDDLER